MGNSRELENALIGVIFVLFVFCGLEWLLKTGQLKSSGISTAYFQLYYIFKYFRVGIFVLLVLLCCRWTLYKHRFLEKAGVLKKTLVILTWGALAYLIWKGYAKNNDWYNLIAVPAFFALETYFSILFGWIIPVGKMELGQAIDFKFPRRNADHFSIKMNTDDGVVWLLNPFRGNLITGSPGCAKTSTILAQQMKGYGERGFCGIIYDYKGFPPTLGRMMHNILNDEKKNNPKKSYPELVQFNLSAPCLSKRINLLPVSEKENSAYARELTSTLFSALGSSGGQKVDDYWTQTASLFVEGVMRMLLKNFPACSTLPHAIAFVNASSQDVLEIVALENELRPEIRAILEPHEKEANQQTAGIVSSAQSSLRKLNLPEVFWLLSGDEVNLEINDTLQPIILNVCSESKYRESYGAVCAAVIGVALKKMNQKGRKPSFVIIDEASTAKFTGTTEIVAQGRENKIALTMVFQSKAQAREVYGDKTAQNILTVPANQFYGAMADTEEAQKVANSFGQYDRQKEGFSMADHGSSLSINTQRENKVPVEKINNLRVREFVSTIADAPEKFITRYSFCSPQSDQDIPIVYQSQYLSKDDFYKDFDELYSFCLMQFLRNKNMAVDATMLIGKVEQAHLAMTTRTALEKIQNELYAFLKFKIEGVGEEELDQLNKKYKAFSADLFISLIRRIQAQIVQCMNFLELEGKRCNEKSLKKDLKKPMAELRYLFYLEVLNGEMMPMLAKNKTEIYKGIDTIINEYQKVKSDFVKVAAGKFIEEAGLDQAKAQRAAEQWYVEKIKMDNALKKDVLERLKANVNLNFSL